MKLLHCAAALALLGASLGPSPALAAGPGYDWLEADYVKSVPDDSDIEADGFGAQLSHLLNRNVFLTAGYLAVETDEVDTGFGTGTFELSELRAGLGLRERIGRTSDLVASAAMVRADVQGKGVFAGADADDSGLELTLGIRTLLTRTAEFGVAFDYVDISDDSVTYVVFDTFLPFNTGFGLAASAGISNDEKIYRAGLRFKL
jgi:hypothetical protein